MPPVPPTHESAGHAFGLDRGVFTPRSDGFLCRIHPCKRSIQVLTVWECELKNRSLLEERLVDFLERTDDYGLEGADDTV